jgi:hypothetical protein
LSAWPSDNGLQIAYLLEPWQLYYSIPARSGATEPSVLFAITFANAPFAYFPDRAHDPAIPEEALPETVLLMSAGWASQL